MADRKNNDLIAVYRKENTIFFYDELDRVSIYELQSLMDDVYNKRKYEELNIVINSWGGYTCSIYDYVKDFPLPVNTYCMGVVCSAATILYLAGDKRYISPTGLFMIHSHQGLIKQHQKLSNAEDVYDEIKKLNDITLLPIYEKECTIPKKVLEDKLKYEDKYFTPEDCIKYKIAHEIKVYSNH